MNDQAVASLYLSIAAVSRYLGNLWGNKQLPATSVCGWAGQGAFWAVPEGELGRSRVLHQLQGCWAGLASCMGFLGIESSGFLDVMVLSVLMTLLLTLMSR